MEARKHVQSRLGWERGVVSVCTPVANSMYMSSWAAMWFHHHNNHGMTKNVALSKPKPNEMKQ